MKQNLDIALFNWPKRFLQERELAILMPKSSDARDAIIRRAIHANKLIRVKNGLYVIGKDYQKTLPNPLEIAQLMYGPSYISLESALGYHNWIPEAVYSITSVCPKKGTVFKTPIGSFEFAHTPKENFYIGVERIETADNEIFFLASGWKALADLVYVRRKSWEKLQDIISDMRIEEEDLKNVDTMELKALAKHYPSKRVRVFLKKMYKELFNGH